MGKPTTKKKKSLNNRTIDSKSKNSQGSDHSPKVFDEDTSIFIDMSREIKEEGNKLFQKRNYDGALLRYEKAIKLLPKNHVDVAYLRSNLATCYMYMTPAEYHNAVNECNLALEVAPKYTKALVKRAKCFEALNRLDLACKDVNYVLALEPNNLTALEISERIKKVMEEKGIKLDDKPMISTPDVTVVKERVVKEKHKKKKSHKGEEKVNVELKKSEIMDEQEVKKEEPAKIIKLVFGEDIRFAQMSANASVSQLREIVRNRFPSLKSVLIKYKDQEGDLVTITTSEELRLAEESRDPNGSLRLFITEVNPEHEPLFEGQNKGSEVQGSIKNFTLSKSGSMRQYDEDDASRYIDSWIIQFAQMFKNHAGFNSDACLDLHDLGMKLYSEAMEDIFTSEEAQEIFEIAEGKFQEMAALALFNWGNVHMYRASKRLHLPESASDGTILENIRLDYEWACEEYTKAGKKYEEAIKMKPDFYEGYLALGKQQYEQAKVSWYYVTGSKVDLTTWPSSQVLELLNNAEDNMERGTALWEEIEEQRLKNLNEPNKDKIILGKMGMEGLYYEDLSNEEAAELASNMKSQINLLWGALLYERSVFEYKLGLPTWEDCLMVAVEKFKVAGASPTDIAVMIKNHIAHETTQEGLGFNIDEIVQAWHEMHDAKRWTGAVLSFRLEPLFRRQVPKLHHILDPGFN